MNSFFGIGFMELAFIAILALIVLGPERLPGAAREIAKVYQQIRGLSTEFTSQFSEELKIIEDLHPQKLMNDLVQDTVNPTKKKPVKKTAKPLAVKKPAATEESQKAGAVDDGDADAGNAASATPVTTETSMAGNGVENAEQVEEHSILPPAAERAAPDTEVPVTTASNNPPSIPATPVEETLERTVINPAETTAQQETDDNA